MRESATSIPYRGQKRWHTLFGLIFGLGAATWAFSGMLSMDPFPSPSGGPAGGGAGLAPTASRTRCAAASDMGAFAAKHPREALTQLAALPADDVKDVRELEFTSFAGEPIYLATLAGGDTHIVPVDGDPRPSIDHQRIIES